MSEVSNKTTHAQRRRLEARKSMRMKLRAGQFIRRLREIATKADSVDPTKIPALRLKADIYSRLLAKCLPDLKAVELTGDVTHRTEISPDPLSGDEWDKQYGHSLETPGRPPESVN